MERKPLFIYPTTRADGYCANAHIRSEPWLARDITARDIDAHDIDAHDITARDIDAHDIDAHDIDASDIIAIDIAARDIDAHDIDARDIDAHGDIIARSIKLLGSQRCEKISDLADGRHIWRVIAACHQTIAEATGETP